MLQLIIQFLLYYLSNGRLQEIRNKRKFQTFSSKSGRGRSWEVAAYMMWSQSEVRLYFDGA